jgi:DNA modification methylase
VSCASTLVPRQVWGGNWSLHHGQACDVLREMAKDSVDVCIADPPYSEKQHRSSRSSGRNRGLADGQGRKDGCATRRTVDLGFAHFTRADVQIMCLHLARVVKRWSLVFCDDVLLPVWRSQAERAGLQFVRTGVWVRIGGAPQFTGDRPGTGAEYVAILHRPGRKRWNGHGMPAIWTHPIVANRKGQQGSRIHTTQKPESLMLELVNLFSEPGEIVLDPTAGAGTTGVAAIRLGRRFVGIEMQPRVGFPGDVDYFGTCLERLRAEENNLTIQAARSGQQPLFAGSRP